MPESFGIQGMNERVRARSSPPTEGQFSTGATGVNLRSVLTVGASLQVRVLLGEEQDRARPLWRIFAWTGVIADQSDAG